MKKFIFKDKTIIEARMELLRDLGSEYQLNNGELVIINKVSEIKEIEIGSFDFDKLDQIFPDGALSIGRMTKYTSYIGFEVEVKKCRKNGGYEIWTEKIFVPLRKETIETDYERSLIHTA